MFSRRIHCSWKLSLLLFVADAALVCAGVGVGVGVVGVRFCSSEMVTDVTGKRTPNTLETPHPLLTLRLIYPRTKQKQQSNQ